MPFSPLTTQFLVAGTTHLAAFSVGGVVGYPSVLLQQLQANDTIIQLDLHKRSWIGSVHGMAGILSIFLPYLMQWRGRKFAFILSIAFLIAGWVLTYVAQNIIMLIIGEGFHGLSANSILAISFFCISEMVQPKYRNTCLLLYGTAQALGMSMLGVVGRYLHWKTVGFVMGSPVIIAGLLTCAWPESPSWLAFQGKFDECEQTFLKLRGTDDESKKELKALLNSHKVNSNTKSITTLQHLRNTFTSRDFYLPTFHTFVLISFGYWGGAMPIYIYSSDIIIKLSGKFNYEAKLTMDLMFFIGFVIAAVLVRYFGSKKVMLLSASGSMFFIIPAAIVAYLQSLGTVPKDSNFGVYCVVGYIGSLSLGACCLGYSIASEIMPVKHKGVGGCLYVLFGCVLHSSSLKAYPYLSVYMNLWGVFLIYIVYGALVIIIIWCYVPDTRNRTLQDLEDYYLVGYFKKLDRDDHVDVPFIKSDVD